MSEHTPGPWTLGKKEKGWQHIDSENLYSPWYQLASVAFQNRNYQHPESQANARLIAAAPCLLDALEQVLSSLDWIESSSVCGDSKALANVDLVLVKRAIAKATGKGAGDE